MLTSLVGCADPDVIQADPDAGEILVGGWIGLDGNLSEPFLLTGEHATKRLDRQDDSELIMFQWSSTELIDASGEHPTQETLANVALGIRAGSCGRCTDPFAEDLQLIAPGDDCPPPRFARVRVTNSPDRDEAQIERARQALVLSWPGQCECSATSILSAPEEEEIALKPIDPAEELEFYAQAAASDDGRIVLFGLGRARAIDPAGAFRDYELPELTAPPHRAIATRHGFVVALLVPARGTVPSTGRLLMVDLLVFDRNLAFVQRIETPLGDLSEATFVGDQLVLGGRTAAETLFRTNRAALWTCDVTELGLTCADILERTRLLTDGVQAVRLLDNGVVVAVLSNGRALLLERAIAPVEVGQFVETSTGGSVTLKNGGRVAVALTGRNDDFVGESSAIALGDRFFSCLGEAVGSFRVTSALELSDLKRDACAAVQPFRSCAGFTREGPNVRVWFPKGASTLLGPDGQAIGEPCSPAEAYDLVHQAAADLSVRRDPGGGWTVGTSTGSRSLYPSSPRAHRLFVRRAQETWAMDASSVVVFDATGESRIVALDPPLDEEPVTGAFVGSDDEILVALGDGALVTIRSDGSTQRTGESVSRYTRIVAMDSKTLAVLSPGARLEEARLGRYSGGELTFTPMHWDDPRTEEIEEPPKDCLDAFETSDTSGGVAWVAGCDGYLSRILPSSNHLRAERVSTQGVAHNGARQKGISAVHSACADHVLTAVDSPDAPDLPLFEYVGPQYAEVAHDVAATIPGGNGAWAVFDVRAGTVWSVGKPGFIDRRQGRRLSRILLSDSVRAGMATPDAILFGTDHGRLYAASFE